MTARRHQPRGGIDDGCSGDLLLGLTRLFRNLAGGRLQQPLRVAGSHVELGDDVALGVVALPVLAQVSVVKPSSALDAFARHLGQVLSALMALYFCTAPVGCSDQGRPGEMVDDQVGDARHSLRIQAGTASIQEFTSSPLLPDCSDIASTHRVEDARRVVVQPRSPPGRSCLSAGVNIGLGLVQMILPAPPQWRRAEPAAWLSVLVPPGSRTAAPR